MSVCDVRVSVGASSVTFVLILRNINTISRYDDRCAPAPRGATRPAPARVRRRLPPSGRRRVPRAPRFRSTRARRAVRVRSRGWGGRVSARAGIGVRRRARRGALRARAPDSLSHSRARAETPPTAARGPASPRATSAPPARRRPRCRPWRCSRMCAAHRAAHSGRRKARRSRPRIEPAAGPRGRFARLALEQLRAAALARRRRFAFVRGRPSDRRRLVTRRARAGKSAPFAARRPPRSALAVEASAPTHRLERDALDGARLRFPAERSVYGAPRRARSRTSAATASSSAAPTVRAASCAGVPVAATLRGGLIGNRRSRASTVAGAAAARSATCSVKSPAASLTTTRRRVDGVEKPPDQRVLGARGERRVRGNSSSSSAVRASGRTRGARRRAGS